MRYTRSSTAGKEGQSITLNQYWIPMWTLLLYLVMVAILLTFLVGFRGRSNSIFSLPWTEAAMSKGDATILVCIYAALGWAMSNGFLAHPNSILAS